MFFSDENNNWKWKLFESKIHFPRDRNKNSSWSLKTWFLTWKISTKRITHLRPTENITTVINIIFPPSLSPLNRTNEHASMFCSLDRQLAACWHTFCHTQRYTDSKNKKELLKIHVLRRRFSGNLISQKIDSLLCSLHNRLPFFCYWSPSSLLLMKSFPVG